MESGPRTIKERFRGFLPVVVDLETSGFNPHTAALLQVSMMTVAMDEHGMLHPDELFTADIRPFPQAQFEESNIRFIGLDPFDENRPLEPEGVALPRLMKAIAKKVKAADCRRAILVGHNAAFDQSFLQAAVARINYKRSPFHPFSVMDTASLAGLVYGQTVLARACMAAGIPFDETCAHRADYDTRLECELFCHLVNRFTTFAGFPEPLSAQDEAKLEQQRQHRAMQMPELLANISVLQPGFLDASGRVAAPLSLEAEHKEQGAK